MEVHKIRPRIRPPFRVRIRPKSGQNQVRNRYKIEDGQVQRGGRSGWDGPAAPPGSLDLKPSRVLWELCADGSFNIKVNICGSFKGQHD